MKAADARARFPTEAALCAAFIGEFNAVPGWTCYPETGGFDVLVVHESGRQIGVEAKLQLNAKVCDQILPQTRLWHYTDVGPDHRLVIVPYISDGAAGIAKMLNMLGVEVWETSQYNHDDVFNVRDKMHRDSVLCHWYVAMFDWNPVERIKLPGTVPEVPAGVAAPVRLTPWKEGALRVLAHLERYGRIQAKQIVGYGVSPTIWITTWLERAPERGWWLETLETPRRHATQNPLAYAAAQEFVRKKGEEL